MRPLPRWLSEEWSIPFGGRISIVINTLNRARSLARTLAGLERLSGTDFEVVVVAGPCTDDTDEVLARYAPRIRVGRCPQASLGTSRNIGVDMAAGEIVAFTDDDAIPREDWIEELRKGYADKTAGAVGGPVWDAVNNCIQWKVSTVARDGVNRTDTPPPYEGYQGRDANPYLYLSGCNMSFRRGALIDAGGFNEDLRAIYDDAEIAGRVHRAGYRVVSRQTCLVDHFSAESPIRDARRVVRDPYAPARDFGIFVSHSRLPGDPEAAALASVAAQRRHWRAYATVYLRGSVFRRAEHDEFVRRADQGLDDGLAAGAAGRKMRAFPPAAAGDFRAFIPRSARATAAR